MGLFKENHSGRISPLYLLPPLFQNGIIFYFQKVLCILRNAVEQIFDEGHGHFSIHSPRSVLPRKDLTYQGVCQPTQLTGQKHPKKPVFEFFLKKIFFLGLKSKNGSTAFFRMFQTFLVCNTAP